MAFSATDAAFEGFRLVRRNPMALVAWTLLYTVLSLASVYIMSRSAGPLMALTESMKAFESSPPTTSADFAPFFQGYAEVMNRMLWLIPVSLVVSAMLTAAIARGVLNPRAKGFGYLRFGMDEVRVFVVTLVLALFMGLVSMCAFAAVGVFAGLAAGLGAGWMWLLVLAAGLGAVALLIWLSVRLSLAVPITVAENRFAFFDSFAVTRGRFWPLFGMALIAGIMVLVIGFLSMIIRMPLSMASGLGSWSGTTGTDAEMMMRAFDLTNPWVVVGAIADAVVSALTVGVLYAPFAAAYRDIKGLGPETPTA
ncbi:hypothetical protein [Brevundimonas lenta]|uniref:Uncharacterized protein n=1 Tax=Brevundimonas lenta TaxID=424796 RepID=A0A7W6JDI5_9CAUL|nr:hypothetical protein [Brevundimonas lenta]MBB4083066.1 hypothetical protein [Brevundimonas lenta]